MGRNRLKMDFKTRRIDREDMLALTRRMTIKRTCFSRIAGAYFDRGGEVDGTFNTHFKKLSLPDQEKYLAIAKAIPFGDTNAELRELIIPEERQVQGSFWQCLRALAECELKNDGLLDVLYEMIAEKYKPGEPFAVYFFTGSYDIPKKGSDKASLWESEQVYRFIIGALCPVYEEYEPGPANCGIMFPAFTEGCGNLAGIDVYCDSEVPECGELFPGMI